MFVPVVPVSTPGDTIVTDVAPEYEILTVLATPIAPNLLTFAGVIDQRVPPAPIQVIFPFVPKLIIYVYVGPFPLKNPVVKVLSLRAKVPPTNVHVAVAGRVNASCNVQTSLPPNPLNVADAFNIVPLVVIVLLVPVAEKVINPVLFQVVPEISDMFP